MRMFFLSPQGDTVAWAVIPTAALGCSPEKALASAVHTSSQIYHDVQIFLLSSSQEVVNAQACSREAAGRSRIRACAS